MSFLAANALTINLVCSTIVFALAARLYLVPWLRTVTPQEGLRPILLLHALRHLGLMFLAPGAVLAGLPRRFMVPAALGDALAAVLAVAALLALVSGSRAARVLVWVFNVEGSVDLVAAVALANATSAAPFMGAAYWIPAFWVPMLLVTHWLTFGALWQPWPAGIHAWQA